ncbi:TetR/AcrR family transcriptional regulator [Nocardia callitridis]|uniref:TetR family transcriptional regulator n=1 Tax=Nocardia callitridis TaxID=648753 RepID=A0ABP9JWZ5_9NOCA
MAVHAASESVVAGSGTKLAIRDAATTLFGAKGFEQTSLREVADAVGITKASLYYHYSSKLDLLMAIINPIIDHMRTVSDELAQIPRDADGIRTVLGDYLRGLIEHRDVGVLLSRDAVAILNASANRYPDILDANRALLAWLAGPDATDEGKLRAGVAIEILRVAMVSKDVVPGGSDELVERVLLDAATTVLSAGEDA